MSRAFIPHVITEDSALGGSVIQKSLRFNSGDNANLTRTSGSTSTTFTYSVWIKRCKFSGYQYIFSMGGRGFSFHTSNNTLYLYDANALNESTAIFRDPSAWYHILVQINSGVATSYVNGVLVHNAVGSGFTLTTGSNATRIGSYADGAYYFDGYMAEIHLVDGSVVAPSSFGYTDFQTGIWRPKKYEGTHGTNGFYLNFSDNSGTTATTLGKDSSGNGNNFTPNNFATTDAVKDSPTNNFCTQNPLDEDYSSASTFSEGNLKMSRGTNHGNSRGTMGMSSGKWYFEYCLPTTTTSSESPWVGVCNSTADMTAQRTNGMWYYGASSGSYITRGTGNPSTSNFGGAISAGTVIGVAVDMDNKKIWLADSNTWFGSSTNVTNGNPSTGTNPTSTFTDIQFPNGNLYPQMGMYNYAPKANFGQDSSFSGTKTAQGNTDKNGIGDFFYTPPTGFLALCSANLPPNVPSVVRPKKHFDILTYTGNGGTNTISGLSFQPDLIWGKERSPAADRHWLADSVRGKKNTGYYLLCSNNTEADTNNAPPDGITAINSDGFTLGANSSNTDGGWSVELNQNSGSYVAWCWKAGGSSNTFNVDGTGYASASAAGITEGSISLTGASINKTSRFSIVTYTGNSTDGATVGHGLGVEPSFVIIKSRNLGTVGSAGAHWSVSHQSLTGGLNGGSSAKKVYLSLTNAETGNSHGAISAASSTTVTFKDGSGNSDDAHVNNSSGNYVMYSWAEVPGYSKFGKYTGNGNNDGIFVYTGFKVEFLLIKRTNTTEHWILADTKRNSVSGRESPADSYLLASASNAESTGIVYDMLSNGFKFRSNSQNESGSTYIYMAFAEQPGSTAYATETTAR